MTSYKFSPGDRVVVDGVFGEVVTCVPGNGSIAWYFIRFEDGVEDRYTEKEIRKL